MFSTIRIGLILILLNICSSSQSFVAIALKPKSNEEKFVIPPCAFNNNGATLMVAKLSTQRYQEGFKRYQDGEGYRDYSNSLILSNASELFWN